MFDIGWPELLLIMVVALVVIGPKDLPAAIRTVTTLLRKLRGMAAEFQSGLADIAREAGVDDVKRSIEDVVSYDPKAALDNLARMDDGEFDYDDPDAPAAPTSENSILDPAIQSQMFESDPDAVPADPGDPVPAPDDGETSTADTEDDLVPRPAAPAAGKS